MVARPHGLRGPGIVFAPAGSILSCVHLDEFFEPKILIVSGKGGVGKTTVAAALALAAARQGRVVCVAEVDRKGTLPRLFGGGELTYEPREMSPGVWGMNIIPEAALAEYLDVQYHMKRISKVLTSSHFVDYITTAAPGLKDILVLGKIWYLEQGRTGGPEQPLFDTIIVDAPAAGHMLTFLQAPAGLSDAVRVGPIKRQSEWLVDMLTNPKRSRVHLVTLAEEMPISETLETSDALEGRLGMSMGPIFANAVYSELLTDEEEKLLKSVMEDGRADELAAPAEDVGLRLDDEDLDALSGYAQFLEARRSIQQEHLDELRDGVDEPVIELPFLFSAGLALPDIETLADAIEEKVEDL
jgi:anion-transporting  ArsA/GET3 family ATPase